MHSNNDYAERIKQYYKMEWLPIEGGYFTVTYHSSEKIGMDCLPQRYQEEKPFGGAILYLLDGDPNCFSAMHRLPTDEVYHFYMGDPIEMLLLFPDGGSEHVLLGQDIFADQKVQFVAPRGAWQGFHLMNGGKFALIGTTMAPGYTPSDFEVGEWETLSQQYPKEAELIRKLTRLE